jgi:N-acetylglucosamine-6-phosphate deacetylase
MDSGHFDLQVNGYGGVDFNRDGLSAADLRRACEALRRDGVGGILATLITDDLEALIPRLRRLVELRADDEVARQIIAGFHLEGPFINETPGYRGAHPERWIRPADPEAMRRLLDAGAGLVRLVTLAPERDPGLRTTAMLASAGITVSAGHTDASLDQLRAAADAGLRMITHLGNGCPQQMPRHDNIVQRGLALSDRLWLCFIADGAHIPFFALRNYLRCAGVERCIVTSDAIAPAGLGPGRYTLGAWDLVIGEDLVARAPDGSHLVGSALSLPRAADNLRRELGLGDAAVDRLTRLNPRIALALAERIPEGRGP